MNILFRWLSYKNDEVNRLNEQNNVIKEQLMQQQAKEKAITQQAKQIMHPDNRQAPTILDSGPSGLVGYGAESRLPAVARREVVAHQGMCVRERILLF
jgi:hypothetical protein